MVVLGNRKPFSDVDEVVWIETTTSSVQESNTVLSQSQHDLCQCSGNSLDTIKKNQTRCDDLPDFGTASGETILLTNSSVDFGRTGVDKYGLIDYENFSINEEQDLPTQQRRKINSLSCDDSDIQSLNNKYDKYRCSACTFIDNVSTMKSHETTNSWSTHILHTSSSLTKKLKNANNVRFLDSATEINCRNALVLSVSDDDRSDSESSNAPLLQRYTEQTQNEEKSCIHEYYKSLETRTVSSLSFPYGTVDVNTNEITTTPNHTTFADDDSKRFEPFSTNEEMDITPCGSNGNTEYPFKYAMQHSCSSSCDKLESHNDDNCTTPSFDTHSSIWDKISQLSVFKNMPINSNDSSSSCKQKFLDANDDGIWWKKRCYLGHSTSLEENEFRRSFSREGERYEQVENDDSKAGCVVLPAACFPNTERCVKFTDDVVTEVKEYPYYDPDDKPTLFYSSQDMLQFKLDYIKEIDEWEDVSVWNCMKTFGLFIHETVTTSPCFGDQGQKSPKQPQTASA